MPVIQRETSLGAGLSNANLLSGSTFEFMRGNVYISIGVTASATGTFITIVSGADIVVEESPPYVATVFPIIPDQMFYNDVATLADRLVISARNPTGGAVTLRCLVQITNL